MIPPEHATPELVALQQKLAQHGILYLIDLTDDDVKLIGMYVQLYCYMELNLRRCIDGFAQAGMLPPDVAKRRHKLATAGLVAIMMNIVRGMNSGHENIPDTLVKLNEIELRRSFRNMLAHWAAKRFPHDDAVAFITRSEKDAQRAGSSLGPGECTYSILMLADLRGLCLHMRQVENWMAQKMSEWWKRYVPESAVDA